jgi:1-acyl-sn-glycerol-3-phosphate acyltransferase
MRFRSLILVLFYVLLVIIVVPVLIVGAAFGIRKGLMAYGKWAMRVSRRWLGIEVETSGLEELDRVRPGVFMANHQSFMDGPLLFMLLPGRTRVILKKSVLRLPVVGPAMRYVGFIPVDRKHTSGGRRSIAWAVRAMKMKGHSFLIFPEGTRSRTGKIQEFRRGGFFLAIESGAPIVPITISGTFELMPKGQWFVRPGRIRVAFHDPVPTAGLTPEDIPALSDRVKAAIVSGLAASSP